MSKRSKEQQYQAALDVYAALPESLQKEKSILIERTNVAKHLRGKPYDDAIRDYLKAFPNEPNLNLLMIDAYQEHRLFDRELTCIDGLDRTVGGDPYLDVLRKSLSLEGRSRRGQRLHE